MGHTPQGEASDCKSGGETHAWFDSKMTHHYIISKGVTYEQNL